MIERVVFTGFGAYIEHLDRPSLRFRLAAAADAKVFTINLDNRPGNAQYGDVDVDDPHTPTDCGSTYVPLRKDEPYAILYLSTKYLDANKEITFPQPPYENYGNRVHEFRSVQYSTAAGNGQLAGQRYYGFHAIWFFGPPEGAYVAVWDGGTSLGAPSHEDPEEIEPAPVPKVLWLDLTDPTVVHPVEDTLQPPIELHKEVSILLNCRAAMNILSIPKLPAIAGSGGETIQHCKPRTD